MTWLRDGGRWIIAAAAAASLAGCSVFGGKAAEEPPYELVLKDGDFEIRDYAAMAVARTRVEAEDYRAAVGEGFGRLFGYITGDNTGEAEIEMTAPVLTEEAGTSGREGAEISMTAPVLTEESAGGWDVTFVLPSEITAETAPRPADPAVRIETVPARRVAIARFSGFLSAENIAENREALMAWLDARGEAPIGPWEAAGYNPPWTIPWMRRNEIMVPISGP